MGLVVTVVIGALALYFLPAIIASSRRATHGGAIFLIDIFLGWTVIGWFGALVWACTDEPEVTPGQVRYPCPFCAEPILRAAKVCPHCRSTITEPTPAQRAGSSAFPVEHSSPAREGGKGEFVFAVLLAAALLAAGAGALAYGFYSTGHFGARTVTGAEVLHDSQVEGDAAGKITRAGYSCDKPEVWRFGNGMLRVFCGDQSFKVDGAEVTPWE